MNNNGYAVQAHWLKRLEAVDVDQADVDSIVAEYIHSLDHPELVDIFSKEVGSSVPEDISSKYYRDLRIYGDCMSNCDFQTLLDFLVSIPEASPDKSDALISLGFLQALEQIEANASVDVVVQYIQEHVLPLIHSKEQSSQPPFMERVDEILRLYLESSHESFQSIYDSVTSSLDTQIRSFLSSYHNAPTTSRLEYLLQNLVYSQSKLSNHSVPLIDVEDFISFKMPTETRNRSFSNLSNSDV